MTTEIKYTTPKDALKAVTQNAYDLGFCTPELQDNEDVVMTAIKQDSWSFCYASVDLKSSKHFIMKAIHEGVYPYGLIRYTTKDVQSSFEVMSLAIEKSKDGLDFKFSQGEVALDKGLAAKALVKWGSIHGSKDFGLWDSLHPTLQEFFPQDSWYEKAQSYLYQLEQEKQAEIVSGGSTTEDVVVW